MPGKIRNQPVIVDNILFDSTAESRRYLALKSMEQAGQIKHLTVHPEFVLCAGVMVHHGTRHRRLSDIKFTPDFAYWLDGQYCIEDVKPFKQSPNGKRIPYMTPVFRLRWAILQRQHPEYVFRVVEA